MVLDKKGKAYKLEDVATKETYVVHPDYIIPKRLGTTHTTPTDNMDAKDTNKTTARGSGEGYNLRNRKEMAKKNSCK